MKSIVNFEMIYLGSAWPTKEYVYEFCYQPSVFESAAGTVSIHRTLLGAYKAMKQHRLDNFWQWRRASNDYRKSFLDTFDQEWFIKKTEIQL